MKTQNFYSLITQSEEKNRSVVEIVVYTALIVSAIVSIFCAAVQPIVLMPDQTANDSSTEYHA